MVVDVRSALAIAAVVVGLVAPATSVGTSGWRKHQEHGYSLSLPSSWRLVPTTRAKTIALASHLRAQGQTKLATVYDSIANEKYQWQPPPNMHAFEWPSAVFTDMLVVTNPTGSGSLSAIAQVLVTEFQKSARHGEKVAAPVHMSGTAEDCYRIEIRGTLPKTYGAQASYTLYYLFAHGKRLFGLYVRGESGIGSGVADRIASSFRFNSR